MKIKKVEGLLEQTKKGYTVTLSKELPDRDAEIVMIDGVDLENFKSNPVLLDAHNMGGSVVDNVLGRVVNPRKEISEDGVKALVGELEFASTPRALIAKSLVDGGFVKTTSIGFRHGGVDRKSGKIEESELYELSLVSVPANVYATIQSKGVKDEEIGAELVKKLKNYEDIKPILKKYRKLFMSKEFIESLGYVKTGDEDKDIEAVFEETTAKLDNQQENPVEEETPQENPDEILVSSADLRELISELL